MRDRLLTLLLLAAAFAATSAPAAARLNVLLLAVDDLNTSLATVGHPLVPTPNFDRPRTRSICIERACCPFPLCSPSRQSFLSGLRPETSGALAQKVTVRNQRAGFQYLPGIFRRESYRVTGVGRIFHSNDAPSGDAYENADSRSPQDVAALKARAAVRDHGEHGPEWTPIDDPGECQDRVRDPSLATEVPNLQRLLAVPSRLKEIPADAQTERKGPKKPPAAPP